jgi:23S rRNA (cytidine1920-2'-O)/16S rRNA (cytidine1409-2'-O)-methyltransferase
MGPGGRAPSPRVVARGPYCLGDPRAGAVIRRRLDRELVRRRLVPSRAQAREAIDAGRVTVGGAPALKATRLVAPGEAIAVAGSGSRYVGRGGDKLAAALDRFDVPVAATRALDVGASTGGFTDCLLQHGAREVVAVDVGYGQLHERLRTDPRVRSLERTNIRDVEAGDLGPPFDVVVADVSFISLRTVLDPLLAQAAPGSHLVLLVKPQFEAGRDEASRGRGVIRDPSVWRRVLGEVMIALQANGAAIMGAMVSPLTGADGNVEFLVHARVAVPSRGVPEPDVLAGAAVDEALARAASARSSRS